MTTIFNRDDLEVANLPKFKLFWRKTRGCLMTYGLLETLRRIKKEVVRYGQHAPISVSEITSCLFVGSAPTRYQDFSLLQQIGITHVIDLRAEKNRFHLPHAFSNMTYSIVPIYDDWCPIGDSFFNYLKITIDKAFKSQSAKLYICCGAGEHRAPLGGALALMVLGHPIEDALNLITQKRSEAELLPVYIDSLRIYREKHVLPS